MGSVCLHGWVLAWVALGQLPSEPSRPLYEREIQPNEKKIVWYKLSDRLPDVTPARARRDPRPPRARSKFEQNMVAGPRDNARPAQLILAQAPEIAPAEPLPLPNIVALAPPPRLVRPFIPPPVKPPVAEKAPTLPEAPKVAAAAETRPLPIEVKPSRPPLRAFTPPKAPKPTAPASPAALPEAPKVAAVTESKPLPIEVRPSRPPLRAFTPPPARKLPVPEKAPATVLPEAPAVAAAADSRPFPVDVKAARPTRSKFTPPAPTAKQPIPAEIPLPAAPALTSAAARPSDTSLVVAGLNPANSFEVPAPPGSVKAGFSGGPKPEPRGGAGAPSGALLEVPSLTIQGGGRDPQPPVMVARASPTSPEALASAFRTAHPAAAAAPPSSSTRQAVRASAPPDPRMYGRQVYTMAIQIPNLTSYSGSWLVWFAEREADLGNTRVDLHPPLPLRMVDPKYINAAAAERVEGKVRLWAVIGRDGHIADVALLQHLDDRLDRSAEEALAKWLFQPATRNGVAVDVDAVFEIPFYVAPKSQR